MTAEEFFNEFELDESDLEMIEKFATEYTFTDAYLERPTLPLCKSPQS